MADRRIEKLGRMKADFQTAAALLRDKNLVWSSDLDAIREDLANYIEESLISGHCWNTSLQRIVNTLIDDEMDVAL
jgi:hypothetical protein